VGRAPESDEEEGDHGGWLVGEMKSGRGFDSV
jgi:hypothetical protein